MRFSAVSAGRSRASNVGGVAFCAGSTLEGKSARSSGVSKSHAASALKRLGTGRLSGFAGRG